MKIQIFSSPSHLGRYFDFDELSKHSSESLKSIQKMNLSPLFSPQNGQIDECFFFHELEKKKEVP